MRTRLGAVAASVAFGLLAFGLLACRGGSGPDSDAASSTTQPPNPFAAATDTSSGTDASARTGGEPRGSLDIGACFDWRAFVAGAPIDPADIVLQSCTGPHQYEVYVTASHPGSDGSPFPGDTTLDAFADDRCLAAFLAYVGTAYERSTLDYAVVRPTQASWRSGDRQVACALHDADYLLLNASMRGSAR